jgi:hypothetical protein
MAEEEVGEGENMTTLLKISRVKVVEGRTIKGMRDRPTSMVSSANLIKVFVMDATIIVKAMAMVANKATVIRTITNYMVVEAVSTVAMEWDGTTSFHKAIVPRFATMWTNGILHQVLHEYFGFPRGDGCL